MSTSRSLYSFLLAAAAVVASGCSGGSSHSTPPPPAGPPALSVTAVNPASGTNAGGDSVTITGTGFITGATVEFGGAPATGVGFVSSTTLTAVTPSGAVGPADVLVTNPSTTTATLTNGFLYVGPNPTISSISPLVGPQSGGTTITINGSNFFAGATVSVGGVPATIVSIASGQIVATTGAGSNGPQNVVVTNLDGNSATATGGFTYQGAAPTISTVAPTNGPQGGANPVTISGTNFRNGATVVFGSTSATPSSVTATKIVVPAPASATATTVGVTVNNVDGTTVTAAGAYTYNPGPAITSLTPNNGAIAGGNTVTIAGANFALPIASVTFGSTGATIQGSPTTSQIVVTVPNGGSAGSVTVTVTVNGGATATTTYTYNPIPTIGTLSPTNGPQGGGTTVTINGSGFIAGATVLFGSTPAASATWVSATRITAVTAAGTGTVGVTVTNPDTQNVTKSSAYTFNPAPVLNTISPTSGTNAGGTTVTLNGSNFLSGATVTFGTTLAGTVTFVSGSQVTISSPNLSTVAGPLSVTITNPDGQSATLAGAFLALGPAPTFTSINANSGPNTGGTTVTITGTNLLTGATVTIGGAAATNLTVNPASQIVCDTPSVAPALGPRDVVITNGDGKSVTATGAFNALAGTPTWSGINPTSGPSTGGTNFTITGTNFFAGATVDIGGTLAGSVDVVNSTTIRGRTLNDGSVTGAVAVTVTNIDGQSVTQAGAFTLNGNGNPTITVVSPDSGPVGATVAINGTNFASGATVELGTVQATVQSITRGTILVTAPTPGSSPPVTVDVKVHNPSASVTLTNGFNYLIAAPVISGVTPAIVSNSGGTTITLTGTGFVSGAKVTVSGGNVSGETVSGGGTQLTFTGPNIAPSTGALRITVENPDGQSDTTRGVLFQGPAPTISAVSPSTGSVGGGTFVTITGNNFIPGATVEFAGVKASYVVTSGGFPGNQITCYTPPGSAGAVTVKITNDDTANGSQTNAFTYVAGPAITSVTPNNGTVSGGQTITLAGSGFAAGDTVMVGGLAATSVNVGSATQITCVTPGSTVFGPVSVTVTPSTGPVTRAIDAYTYRNGVNAQTAVYTWDTSTGIDCTRRWYVNLNEGSTLKDLQNRGLQSWGTPGDSTRPPAALPLVDQYALDWMRAYVLRSINIIYGRNPDGTKISGQSINITFTGLQPTTGKAAPWVCGPNDYSVISCGGCNNGTFTASQTGSGCSGGVIGTAPYDNNGTAGCNANAEHVSNSVYHTCPSCGVGLGIFAANIGNAWGQNLSPRLSASDQQYLDGTVNAGARYNAIHNFMVQFARRISFVAAHEMGHSLGLAADGTFGPCPRSSGQCGATPAHTSCCGTNLMAPSLGLGGTSTDYSRGFGGNPDPGNPSKASSCGSPVTTWQVLQAWVGVSP